MKKLNLKLYDIAIHLFLIVLIGLVITLVIQNKKLKDTLAFVPPESYKVGDVLNNFNLVDFNNKIFDLNSFLSTKKVIKVFNTKCPYCTKNIPMWNDLFINYPRDIDVFAIGIDSSTNLIEYIDEHKILYKVFMPVDEDFRIKNKIYGIPQTIILNENNKILEIFYGVLDESSVLKIKACLDG